MEDLKLRNLQRLCEQSSTYFISLFINTVIKQLYSKEGLMFKFMIHIFSV
ncbi:unnamed protein product [Paramecium sonneborni]|uniref:Uncharacterized protein n=1 Tax=Paramecium sonneborni TaxID=65129 RepID=A0A8S1M5X9_9CILI|nr:unnamed protein product [Paramecium sonneborni]